MSYVVHATYEHGLLKLDRPLPLKDREKVRVTVESPVTASHSVLDIQPVSVGQVLRLPAADEDLLGEMLEAKP